MIAAKVFAEDVRCKRKGREGKSALAEAMERLMAKGAIKIEQYGKPSNPHERVVRAYPDSHENDE